MGHLNGEHPELPTSVLPGSEDKIQLLATRHRKGLPLWHEHDAVLDAEDIPEKTGEQLLEEYNKFYASSILERKKLIERNKRGRM